jgi:dienelactone hydrolase
MKGAASALVIVLGGSALAPLLCSSPGPPPPYPDRARLLVYRSAGGQEHPVRSPRDWEERRRHILAHMQEVMGPLPADSRKVPLDVRVTEEVKEGKYLRRQLTFAVEEGDRVPGYLLLPLGRRAKEPAVLCLHPTDRALGKRVVAGPGGRRDRQYAVHLAERGYVTLAPDYVNSGEYQYDPYRHGYASATMKGIWNHRRAVDLLCSLPEVDPERIGVIGHSLGGHNGLFVAAFDRRIRCVVSSCGFCSFPRYYRGDLTGWSHDGYMPRIRTVYGGRPEKVPFDFPEVVAALAPRPFLAIAPLRDSNFDVEGVKECIQAARPVYQLLGAPEKLAAIYPDGGHDFLPAAQAAAYAWLDRWLKPNDRVNP